MTLTMADSTEVADLPAGLGYYAGYISGAWPNAVDVQRRFPKATVLTIATSSAHDADALDIEKGDATPAVAAGWVKRQQARGLSRPVVYSSQSQMPSVLGALAVAGIPRAAVRVWTAHYTLREHICSPAACNADGYTADGTQWADPALGRGHYDLSALADDFFGAPPQPVQEDDMALKPITPASGPSKGHAFASDGVWVRTIPAGDGLQDGVNADWYPSTAVEPIGEDTFDTLVDANALVAQLASLAKDVAAIKAALTAQTKAAK